MANTRTEEAIVLAGGLGTRLRPSLSDRPKSLAPVAGRPFLAYLLGHFAEAGLRRVILATGYLGEQVEACFGAHFAGLDVAYSREPEPLGTGGALALAAQQLHGPSAHVANGDSFLRFDPRALEAAARREGTPFGVALARVVDVGRYGAVEVRDGRVCSFREKGGQGAGLINAGNYFFDAAGLARLPRGRAFSLEEEVLRPAAAAGEIAWCEGAGFIDIGVPEDLERAQSLWQAPA